MKVFKEKSKVYGFVTINDGFTHAYLGNDIVTIPGQVMRTIPLIMEMYGETPPVMDSTHYIK
jgi:hypothetical protein